MPTYKVHMLAFADEDKNLIREVNIPDEILESNSIGALIESIFYFGQNDVQIQKICSVSAGDVAEVDGKYYLYQFFGYREMPEEEFKKYKDMDFPERMAVWMESDFEE